MFPGKDRVQLAEAPSGCGALLLLPLSFQVVDLPVVQEVATAQFVYDIHNSWKECYAYGCGGHIN